MIIPENYSGNAFRVKDETERHVQRDEKEIERGADELPQKSETVTKDIDQGAADEKEPRLSDIFSNGTSGLSLSSILRDVNAEDIFLLALIFLIYREDPNDDLLLLLVFLLFLK